MINSCSLVSPETKSEGPTKAAPIYWLCWVLTSYGTKICYAAQTKLCLQNNFVAEGNSNYMKDNYDVKLLQWENKIIKYTLLMSKVSFTTMFYTRTHTHLYVYIMCNAYIFLCQVSQNLLPIIFDDPSFCKTKHRRT